MPGQRLFQFVGSADNHTGTQWPYEFPSKIRQRPVIPEDMSLVPEQDFLVANVIIDGHIIKKNLQHAGKDIQWLNKQMHAQNISNLREVLLATCDMHNQVTFYQKTHQKMTSDILD